MTGWMMAGILSLAGSDPRQETREKKPPVSCEKGRSGTGTLTGVVHHKSVRKFPTVVYVDEMPDRKFKPPEKPAHVDQKNDESTSNPSTD